MPRDRAVGTALGKESRDQADRHENAPDRFGMLMEDVAQAITDDPDHPPDQEMRRGLLIAAQCRAPGLRVLDVTERLRGILGGDVHCTLSLLFSTEYSIHGPD